MLQFYTGIYLCLIIIILIEVFFSENTIDIEYLTILRIINFCWVI